METPKERTTPIGVVRSFDRDTQSAVNYAKIRCAYCFF